MLLIDTWIDLACDQYAQGHISTVEDLERALEHIFNGGSFALGMLSVDSPFPFPHMEQVKS